MDTFCTIVGFALFSEVSAKSVRQGSYCVWRHNTVDFFSVYFAQCVYIRKLLWGNTALRCKLNWKFNLFGSEVNNPGLCCHILLASEERKGRRFHPRYSLSDDQYVLFETTAMLNGEGVLIDWDRAFSDGDTVYVTMR